MECRQTKDGKRQPASDIMDKDGTLNGICIGYIQKNDILPKFQE